MPAAPVCDTPAYWPRAVHPRAGPFPRPPASRRISPETVQAARAAARKIGLEAWLFGPGPDPGATPMASDRDEPTSTLYDRLKGAEEVEAAAKAALSAARDHRERCFARLHERIAASDRRHGRLIDGRVHALVMKSGAPMNAPDTFVLVPVDLI